MGTWFLWVIRIWRNQRKKKKKFSWLFLRNISCFFVLFFFFFLCSATLHTTHVTQPKSYVSSSSSTMVALWPHWKWCEKGFKKTLPGWKDNSLFLLLKRRTQPGRGFWLYEGVGGWVCGSVEKEKEQKELENQPKTELWNLSKIKLQWLSKTNVKSQCSGKTWNPAAPHFNVQLTGLHCIQIGSFWFEIPVSQWSEVRGVGLAAPRLAAAVNPTLNQPF